jgi:hypothetical protein
MTPRLRAYLELERLMLVLDEAADPAADALRDAMDPIWYSLSDDERRILDDRTIGRIVSLEGIRVPATGQMFGDPPAPAPDRPLPQAPIDGWLSAA